jgi:tetratricopeptide (TPR) repeat protein
MPKANLTKNDLIRAPLPRKKRILFTLLLLILPLFLLTMFEMGLRIVGYGESYPLVKKVKKFGREKFMVNREVTKRYFNLPDEMIPEASEEIFDFEKKPNSVRVVCLGGSTTAGFPYELNATFPFQLQYRLRDALLDNYVEVINLGISAVNSYSVLDLMPEIIKLKPDAILIYMGHNEFYGAFGTGSSQYISSNRKVVLLYLKLRRLRIVQLISKLIHSAGSIFSSERDNDGTSLMETMARKQEIPYQSSQVQKTARNFEENLDEIIKLARDKNIIVVVSTLVSNLKDQKPFVSQFSSDLDPYTSQECQELLIRGRSYLTAGQNDESSLCFSRLAEIDSSSADLNFYWGELLLKRKQYRKALDKFTRARDLDMLRFRAPAYFNSVIESVAKKNNVLVVKMDQIFKQASMDSIPGAELFCDHLHPNFNGYRLMAQTFFEVLRKIQFINPPKKIEWQENLLEQMNYNNIMYAYLKEMGSVTNLDLEFGSLRVFVLTNRWPFTNFPADFSFYRPIGSQITTNLAKAHVKKDLDWDEAHYQLADYYIRENDFQKAFEEYRAVNLTYYENYYPHLKIGDLYALQENYRLAQRWYKNALNYDPQNLNILIKLGQIEFLENNFQEALSYFNNALNSDKNLSDLNDLQKATIYYLMSVSNANLKNWNEAQKYLDLSLHFQKNFAPALKLKNEIATYLKK